MGISATGRSQTGQAAEEAQATLFNAPKGPIEAKYNLFFLCGEPGWPDKYNETWSMGDVGTAKTSAAMDSMILTALNYPGSHNLVTRNFATELMESTYETFVARAGDLIGTDSKSWLVWNETHSTFYCYNGSSIVFLGLDRAGDRLFGEEWFRAVIDQGERVKEHSLNLLHSRMRQQVKHKDSGELGKTFIKLTANWDKGKGYAYRRVIQGGRMVAPDVFEKTITENVAGREVTANMLMIYSRIDENHSLTDDYYKHLLLSGELRYKIAGGGFVDAEGLVFPEYNDSKTIGRVDYFEDANIIVGLDYGQAHPTVAIFGALRPNGDCEIVGDYIKNNSEIKDYAFDIGRRLTEYQRKGAKGFYVYADPSLWNRTGHTPLIEQFIDTFNKLPFEVAVVPAFRKRAGSVEKGVDAVKAQLRNLSLRISDRATNVKRMLQEVTYEDVRKDAVPVTDVFDAMRYLAMNTQYAVPEDDAAFFDLEEEDLVKAKLAKARQSAPGAVKGWAW